MLLEVQKRIPSLKSVISSLLSILSSKFIGILIFALVLAYIANKSFVDPRDHLRTTTSFIILTIALGLILYSGNKISKFMGFTFILILIFAPFYWRFQGFDTDGYTIAGAFPQSDANGYFVGALKILYGEKIPVFAARRPLFSAFLSVLLFVFQQNFLLTILFLALLMSVTIFLLSMEVRDLLGGFRLLS